MPKNCLLSLKKLPWVRNDYVIEILLISVLIVPFLSIIDVAWFFAHESMNEWNIIHTPIAIKALKDILLILLLVILVLRKKIYSLWSKVSFTLFIVILVFAISKALIDKVHVLVILSGIRWYLPIFLFPLFDQFLVKKEDMINFYERYRYVIFAALPLQLLQIFFSNRWNIREGAIYSRASGFFSQPQPMSLFALFFLIIVVEVVPEKSKKLNYFITFISVVLTKSAAGVLGLGSLFFTKAPKKYKLIIGFITFLAIATFPLISGRVDYWQSPLERFKLLTEVNFDNTIFGSYSNTCSTIQKISPQMKICRIPDSYITSSIGNLGLPLGIIMLGALICSICISKKYYLLPIFLLFLISANLTEYFPLNILFPFIIGFKWKEKDSYA